MQPTWTKSHRLNHGVIVSAVSCSNWFQSQLHHVLLLLILLIILLLFLPLSLPFTFPFSFPSDSPLLLPLLLLTLLLFFLIFSFPFSKGVTFGEYGGSVPQIFGVGDTVPPLFRRLAKNTVGLHWRYTTTGFNSRSKLQFANVSYIDLWNG